MSIRPGQKFDRDQLWELIKQKKGNKEIAKILGVSSQSVYMEKKKLRLSIVKETSLETAHRIVEKELDVADQLARINKHTNFILEDLLARINKKETTTADIEGQKDIRTLALDAIKENRQQLTLQMEIFKTLADYRQQMDFQREVLDTIGNANKCPSCGETIRCLKCEKEINLGKVITQKLRDSKALRATVELAK